MRFKLVFFAPRTDTARILTHLFSKTLNVGRIGDYQHCAFITPGVGQFMPTQTAHPTIGSTNVLERVDEDRVELLVIDGGEKVELTSVIQILKEVHPYEQVAYDVYRLEDV